MKHRNISFFSELQEEKELTEMEVSLHRTRALLGEKVIRLRHLEHSLQRVYEKEKPLDLQSDDNKISRKDDATLSDVSSHSSSGFSSTDMNTDTLQGQRKDLLQESSEIMQSLENLNAEIREIWDILSKQQIQGKSKFFRSTTLFYSTSFPFQVCHHHHPQHTNKRLNGQCLAPLAPQPRQFPRCRTD